jgi:hypothetical protein
MEIEYRFRQIRIDKALYIRIKGYCVAHDKKISAFFEEVLQWFFQYKKNSDNIIYHASKQEDHLMTIRISVQLVNIINSLAVIEKLSDARVIFTALSLYLEAHEI